MACVYCDVSFCLKHFIVVSSFVVEKLKNVKIVLFTYFFPTFRVLRFLLDFMKFFDLFSYSVTIINMRLIYT